MISVTVTFTRAAERAPVIVTLNNHHRLNPRAAVDACNMAAGAGATVLVTNGHKTYQVTENHARKV